MSGDQPCSVEECDRPVCARGLCMAHYQRQRRHGELGAGALLRPGFRPEATAAVTVSPSGHCQFNKLVMDHLGHPSRIMAASSEGVITIWLPAPGDHRPYSVSQAKKNVTRCQGVAGLSRITAESGLRPNVLRAKYRAELSYDERGPVVTIRAGDMLAKDPRGRYAADGAGIEAVPA